MADANQPADRRHDPLAYAAEMIEQAETDADAASTPDAKPAAPPAETPDREAEKPRGAVGEAVPAAAAADDEHDGTDPRSRRRSAKNKRQEVADRRRAERAAARSLAASKRHARDRDSEPGSKDDVPSSDRDAALDE